ncbi:MAG: hypothetical protein FWF03_04275 [Defluviitaleaceae bacterium]|nr:hypothetical protein [Defluviitaleaceae bacterium]
MIKRAFASLAAFVFALSLLAPLPVSAKNSYTYNIEFEPVPSPPVYQTLRIVDGLNLECGPFKGATDLHVDRLDRVFILDAGNKRVVVLNDSFDVVKVIDTFKYKGKDEEISANASGVFFHNAQDLLYIADIDNNRIVICDMDGDIKNIFGMPDSVLLDSEVEYRPQRIVVDNLGVMFIISANIHDGILMVNGENEYLGIFGRNDIKRTFAVLLEFARRSFMTAEMRAKNATTFQPTTFQNIFWSHNRFLYAVSHRTATINAEVSKFNAMGETMLFGRDGSLFVDFGNLGLGSDNRIGSITCDRNNIFTLLDEASGKLFQYDENCSLIGIFGGSGNTKETFNRPVAVESLGDNGLILVLDSSKNILSVLEPTYFGRMIRENIVLFNIGRFQESLDGWREVLSINPNYYLAYAGIGKVYYQNEEYREAMTFFKMAQDKDNYSLAKAGLIEENVRRFFPLISAAVVLAMIMIMAGGPLKDMVFRKKKGARSK